MAFIVGMREAPEHYFILWNRCDPSLFLHESMLREAMACGRVTTLAELAMFLDDSGFLGNLDYVRLSALLEINRHTVPGTRGRPRIYWEYQGWYYALEFAPGEDDMAFGYMPSDCPGIPEHDIPDLPMWQYRSIKSML